MNSRRNARKPVIPMPRRAIEDGSGILVVEEYPCEMTESVSPRVPPYKKMSLVATIELTPGKVTSTEGFNAFASKAAIGALVTALTSVSEIDHTPVPPKLPALADRKASLINSPAGAVTT